MSYAYHTQQYRFFAPRERITWAVQRLILLNAAVFAAQLVLDVLVPRASLHGSPGGLVTQLLAFQPAALSRGFLWQPFTYMFLHGGLTHLFMNMLWLFIFGPEVERVLGTRQFVRFYILCGAVGVFGTMVPFMFSLRLVSPSVVGASGATMGILVAYAMTNPEREFFLFPLPVPINARALVIIVIAMNLVSGLGGGNTSVATHFGGMAVGFAYMKSMPVLRRWIDNWGRNRASAKKKADPLGDAVDNIFKFDEEKRRRE